MMSHNHEPEPDLRPTISNQVEEVSEKEEERELDNGELKAVAGGAMPPEAYLDPNAHQQIDPAEPAIPIPAEPATPPVLPPDDPISDLEKLAQSLLPGG